MVMNQGKGLLLTPGSSVANCVWMDTFFYDDQYQDVEGVPHTSQLQETSDPPKQEGDDALQ